jgi:hypothetical protein
MDLSGRIERLLAELKASSSPQSWQRIDALMQSVVELYGQALGRIVSTLDASARHGLTADPLVGSVMALHGLHPLPVETRIARALDDLVREIGAVTLTVVENGVAHLRVDSSATGASLPARGPQAREQIVQLVTEVAPEVLRVEIDGLAAPGAGPLIQIDLERSRAKGADRR